MEEQEEENEVILYLCYIERLHSPVKKESLFRFIFTDNISDVLGDNWDIEGQSYAPYSIYIQKVFDLATNKIDFELLSENDFFTYNNGADGIIALAWEYSEDALNYQRLVFKFGESIKEVEDKLFKRELASFID